MNAAGSTNFNGLIDEVRVYNRTLTSADIQALYSLGSGPPDTQAPTISLTAPANGSTASGIITVSATANDNIGVSGVQFKLDGANLDSEDTTSPYSTTWNTTTASNGSHTLTATTRDTAGNQTTTPGVSVTVNNVAPPADTQSPTAPNNLTATAISSSQINLSWATSTDNVGVTGYRVERCQGSSCTDFAQIATLTGTTFQDTGLIANTTYRYQVRATDAAGNLSGYSNIVSTVTQVALPSSSLVLLDDFEGSDIRMTNPSATTPQEKYLWSQYNTEVDQGVASLSTATVKSGSKSLLITTTLGDPDPQFRPTVGNSVKNLRDFVIPPESWQYDTFNRMRIWIKVASGLAKWTGGQSNTQIGTYVRNTAFDGNSDYETGGYHFYHMFNIPYTGEWHQMIIDTHPNTHRASRGWIELGNQEYPTGESGKNYFDTMTRFYHHIYYSGSGGILYPNNTYYDKIELYRETNPENIGQIYSLNSVYVPQTNQIYVGWMRNKDENSVKHEVRYAFSDIFQMGWNAATPAPNGIVTPPGSQGYNGMDWSTTQIDVSGKSIIYIAIKPQNSSLFRQIAIPLSAAGSPPPSTPLLGDLNLDRTVNGADWSLMSAVWFTADATADLNSDGIVNSIDFSLMNANWGRTI